MTGDLLERLRAEFLASLIGELIYARTEALVGRTLARRDPTIYARSASQADGAQDVVQDFVIDILIGERQLDYIFSVAQTIEDFDRLIQFHLRRYLARTRVRTVVDNLIERALTHLRTSAPYRQHVGASEEFALQPFDANRVGAALDDAARSAAAVAAAVPKLQARGDERAPSVYSAEHLAQVLDLLLQHCDAPIGVSTLDVFFTNLLTAWKPSFLGLDGGLEVRDDAVLPEDEVLAMNLAVDIANRMSDDERVIFAYKHANLPDRNLATHLGVSRQTISPRKQDLFERLGRELADLDERVQRLAIERLAVLIAQRGAGHAPA